MPSVLVLGGAACVWDDLKRAKEIGPFDATFVINDMLAHYEGTVDCAVSLHPEHFERWAKERAGKGLSPPLGYAAHAGNTLEGRKSLTQPCYVTPYLWPGMSASGSSGLFAVKVAAEHGFTKIVLCGVPMDAQAHFHDPKPWGRVEDFWPAWGVAIDHYGNFTRSFSGRTRDLLGEPTQDWLQPPLKTATKEKARWA